jgi:hypothetical protein
MAVTRSQQVPGRGEACGKGETWDPAVTDHASTQHSLLLPTLMVGVSLLAS